jgi:anti-sigma factor RsiW
MTRLTRPSDEQVQDYVDGRLRGRELAAMVAYLLADPELASEIESLRRQNEALKRLGQDVLDEPVPERLRDVIRRRASPEPNGIGPRHARLGVLAGIFLL